jgi:hypothetical protein
MSWSYDESLERIGKHLDNMGEIEIEKLVRGADLETLLTETCCREIHGAHVYVDVSNFARRVSRIPMSTRDLSKAYTSTNARFLGSLKRSSVVFGSIFKDQNCIHCSIDQSTTRRH